MSQRKADPSQNCGTSCQCNAPAPDTNRRAFLKSAAFSASALALNPAHAIAGPFSPADTADHFVPARKKLTKEWTKSLYAKGKPEWFTGNDLKTIGMPIGGICAGMVYLTGDGQLANWDIFNQNINTGYGQINYQQGRTPDTFVQGGKIHDCPKPAQGFAIRATIDGKTSLRALNKTDFPGVRFRGEYPIGKVEYAAPDYPLTITLEAYSPFIPLDADNSILPATILNYTVRNQAKKRATVRFAGYLENFVNYFSAPNHTGRAVRSNESFRHGKAVGVLMATQPVAREDLPEEKSPIVFADFESSDYGEWTIEGEAFGTSPAAGTLDSQQEVSGFSGKGLVNSFIDGDKPHGRLLSPTFKIERRWITFLIGGGSHKNETCINLIIDGKVALTATGKDNELLQPQNWDVAGLAGQNAQIEIVDTASGPWGHINIDQIEFRDTPRIESAGKLEEESDYGTMALAILGAEEPMVAPALSGDALPDSLFSPEGLSHSPATKAPLSEKLRGGAGAAVTIEPGESTTLRFVIAWHFPNMRRGNQIVGNRYAVQLKDARAVVRHIAENIQSLEEKTRLWRDTWYDSTLPIWLLDRLHSTVANLATTTCQLWANGRFWAWEGVGCCHGNCGHVWNYEHAMARLFPTLERSVREMQDFAPGVGLNAETGSIGFRGEGWQLWAGDAQGGYILKAWREHLISGNNDFLLRNWPNIRKAMNFLILQDANADGIIEGVQHQTYDQNYYGPNTMVGSLYLGALRAAEEMALVVGEKDYAKQIRQIFESGKRISMEQLFNGEYFVQKVDLEKYPDWQYADGCLADHLFGQGWAHQVGLGYVYPPDAVRSALQNIWKYNWTPDIALQNEKHKPERWFAYAGEGGLFTCTWPKSKHLGPKSTRYRNEIWTGIEYQVAGHMAWEGMTTETLAICRAIHERYHPAKRNPWNEIECGDHYARALASWSILTGLSGFAWNGPEGQIAFAPKITPENFRCTFTATEGWGTYQQEREQDEQISQLIVREGKVSVREIRLNIPEGKEAWQIIAQQATSTIGSSHTQKGSLITIQFPGNAEIKAGKDIRIRIVYA